MAIEDSIVTLMSTAVLTDVAFKTMGVAGKIGKRKSRRRKKVDIFNPLSR